MTKRLPFIALLVFSPLFLTFGCAGTTMKQVSANDFLARAKRIEAMNSASWTTYIGASATRVYLEYGDMLGSSSKPRTIVYWTELEALPPDIRRKLHEGVRPWVPWHENVDKNTSRTSPEGLR